MAALLPALVAVLVFAGVLVAAVLGVQVLQARRGLELAELAIRVGRTPRVARPAGKVAAAARPRWGGAQLQRLLLHAGGSTTFQAFLTQIAGSAALGAVVGGAVGGPLLGVLGLALGGLPVAWVWQQGRQRSEDIAAQLPDTFEMMARALRAGHAFPDVLRMCGREVRAPLGQELALVSERHRFGLDLRECLLELTERQAGNFDLHLFVSMVLLHQQTGGNLIETLQHLAETMRERAIARDKLRAATAEVRMSAMIVGALPFFVSGVLLWIRPTYMLPLIQAALGQKLLAAALVSLATGFYFMRKLAQVEE